MTEKSMRASIDGCAIAIALTLKLNYWCSNVRSLVAVLDIRDQSVNADV